MKKNGFTLAEVLITLTIIGVIATLTLPALITNTQEQQAVTSLKKGIGTLTDIAQMNSAIDGYDYASMQADKWGETDPGSRSFFAMMANRSSMDFQKSVQAKKESSEGAGDGVSIDSIYPSDIDSLGMDSVIVFRDNTAVIYIAENTYTANSNATNKAAQILADGLPKGFTVIFDTNGFKGPNILSNCAGNAGGAKDADARLDDSALSDENTEAVTTDLTASCTNTKRIIKDQFLVQLRGGYAQPYGAASTWAFNK